MENNTKAYISTVRQHIAGDDLQKALQMLRSLLDHSPLLDEAVHQSGRLGDLHHQLRNGTLSHEDATLTRNQIRLGILGLLEEIEAKAGLGEGMTRSHPPTSPLLAELEKAISVIHSKNVVTGSITAGGDVHIGDKTTTQSAEKIYNIEKIDTANFY